MRLALASARRASGRTHPNPPVGAVVVRGNRVLGRGFTRPPGGPHAEIVALAAATRRFGARALRNATLVVTLEPCCHTGRTGPCCDAILAAGIRHVVIGHRDPNPLVGGRGLRRLRRAGVRVELGVLEAACREQHRGFLSVQEQGRPFVTLKLAATLDGRIATAGGESRWISGPKARAFVHRLRARVDGVVVGSGTAIADDPELTARSARRVLRRPVPIVIDSRLRLAPDARCVREAPPGGALVVTVTGAPATRRRALEAAGARVLAVPKRGGHVDPVAALRRLAVEGLTELLFEGGGRVAAAWIAAGVVDEIHWIVSAKLLGADGRPALGPLAVGRLGLAPTLERVEVRRLGDDVIVRGRVKRRKPG